MSLIYHRQPALLFHDYTSLLAAETALGVTSELTLELVSKAGNTILQKRASRSAWRPSGPIDLSAVTASKHGVASAAGGVIITLAAGHSFGSGGQCRAYLVGTGELGDSPYSRDGADITVSGTLATAVAAAIAAGGTVRVWDTDTELSVGSVAGARDVRILSGAAWFAAGWLTRNGRSIIPMCGRRPVRATVVLASVDADGNPTVVTNQYAGLGYTSGANAAAAALARAATANEIWVIHGSQTSPSQAKTQVGSAAALSGSHDIAIQHNHGTGVAIEFVADSVSAQGYGAVAGNAWAADGLISHAIPGSTEIVTCNVASVAML